MVYLLGSGLNMSCNESFSTNTDAVTHDSDPKLLHFQQVTADIPVDLGTVLDLSLLTLPSIVPVAPAVIGPVLNDLTGGSVSVPLNDVKIGQLTAGQSVWTITYTDASIDTFTFNATDAVALAAAQGLSGTVSSTLDLSSLLTLGVGKTVDTVSCATTIQWTSSNIAPIKYTTSVFQLELTSTDLGPNLHLNTGSSGSIGPGIGRIVGGIDALRVIYDLHNDAATISNNIALTLTPPTPSPVTIEELVTGTASWTITYTDTSTVTLNLTYAQIVAAAIAQALSGTSNGTIDLTLAGLFVPNVGKTIDSVTYTTGVTFSSSGTGAIDYALSGFQLQKNNVVGVNIGNTLQLQAGNGGAGGPGLELLIGPIDTYTLQYTLHTVVPGNVILNLPIDAVTLQSYANPTQLAEQLNPLSVVWSGLFAGYSGWTLTGYTVTSPVAYGSAGPAILVPSVLNFVIGHDNGYVVDAYESQLSNLTTTPPTNFSMFAPRLIVPTSFFGLLFDLHPNSTPEVPAHNGPIIMTEEYEIRSRNQAAFRFISTYPSLPDTNPTYIARCYMSQGKFWNPGAGRFDEYWTSVPMCSSDEAIPSAWGETITISAVSYIPGMPLNYGGTVVTIPSNVAAPGGNAVFGGPWNKLKFVLYPAPGTYDFTGWTLQIAASAREI